MKLYLLRHASAVDIAATDAARELSARGEVEAFKVGKALHKLGAQITHIFASPLTRARQTADIVARNLPFTGPITVLDELTSGTPTQMLLAGVFAKVTAGEVLLIGHMPSLAGHVRELTGEDRVASFTPAGLACLEISSPHIGSGKLLWLKQYHELP
jgi:phosphohistidine phosphatase